MNPIQGESFGPDGVVSPAREALSPWWAPPRALGEGVCELRFEFTSRGDRVPGRLLVPEAEGEADAAAAATPLLLVAHGAGGAKDAASMDAVCLPWARRGAAVALVDLPLHGERASAKLGARWLATLHPEHPADADELRLHVDLAVQARHDLARALDVVASRRGAAAERVGFLGFSLGAILGAWFCAEEPRVAAAVLALAGAGVGPDFLDPARHVARIAPRPLLLVSAERDDVFPRARAEALHAAAGTGSETLWVAGSHRELPGRALKAMERFLRDRLREAR